MYNNIPPEIEARFLEGVAWVDLIAYSQSTAQARATAQYVLALRVNQAIEPFIPPHQRDLFWSLLGAGEGGVTGSTPFWVTECFGETPWIPWVPQDLNTIVRHGGGEALRSFLRSWGCTQTDLKARVPRVRTTASGNLPLLCYDTPSEFCAFHWVFTTPQGKRITVTETQDTSVVRHLLGGATHSLQTMLLTRNIVLAFHPRHCVTRRAVIRAGGNNNFTLADNGELDIRFDDMNLTRGHTGVANGDCGQQCVGMLRRVRGGRGIGLMRWSAQHPMDTLDIEAYGGLMQPKYGYCWTWGVCQTTECDLYHFPRDLRVFGPPPALCLTGTNLKLDVIRKKKYAIINCAPGFATVYEGLLFATSCPNCLFVPVPVDYGIESYATPDDLRAYTWIPPTLLDMPLLQPPTETVGGVTCIHPLSWRLPMENGMDLLIFMATIKYVAPINLSIVPLEGGSKQVHGDVLLMVEEEGKIIAPRRHLEICRSSFQKWWDLGGGLACESLY